MTTPTKRRKKNDYQPLPRPVKSLDYFFNRQKQLQELKEEKGPVRSASGQSGPTEASTATLQLTDEELARHLEEEWNRGDGGDSQDYVPKGAAERGGSEKGEEVSCQDLISTKPQFQSVTTSEKSTLALQSNTSSEDTLTMTIPFDEHLLSFDPSKYFPELSRQWQSLGGQASYGILTRAFVLVNGTQSRIKTVDTLVNFLRLLIEGDPGSLLPAVSYLVMSFGISLMLA